MDIAILQGITVPFIVAAVYIIITITKHFIKSPKLSYFVPIIAAVIGAVLGVVVFFTMPEEMAVSHNIISALVLGAASGLAATGTNQIFKQLDKKKENK